MEDIKYKQLEVDKKDILVVNFDFEYPIEEQNISNLTQTISNLINKLLMLWGSYMSITSFFPAICAHSPINFIFILPLTFA